MEAAFVISPNTVNTINSLSNDDRMAIVSALVGEFLLRFERKIVHKGLSPLQEMIYAMIRSYVIRDTNRYDQGALRPEEVFTSLQAFPA